MPSRRLHARTATTAVLAGAAALLLGTTVHLPAASAAPSQAPVRINAGGAAGTFEGQAYQADKWFVGGTTARSADPVAGTTSSALFQHQRTAPRGYAIPVRNGTYDVTVASAETTFTTAGARRFSITAEGQPVVSDLDLYRTVGHDQAYRVTTRVSVKDKVLDLAFTATVGEAVVSAITVVPATTTEPAPAPTTTTTAAPAPTTTTTAAPAPTTTTTAAPAPTTTEPAPTTTTTAAPAPTTTTTTAAPAPTTTTTAAPAPTTTTTAAPAPTTTTAAPAPTTTAPAPVPDAATAPRLEVAPPVLVNPTTVYLSATNTAPVLDPTKDYRLVIKDGLVDVGTGTLTIGGGRNSVLVGGEIRSTASGRPLMIKRLSGAEGGHVYVEGVRITSSTGTGKEGINVDVRTRGTVLTVQNVLVDPIDGSYSGHHADLVQTWGGNEDGLFQINRFEGTSGYQDFMLNPGQFGYGDSALTYRFSRVLAGHDGDGGIMVYAAGSTPTPGKYRMELHDFTLVHPTKTVIDSSVFVGQYHVTDPTGMRIVKPGSAPSPLLGTPGRGYVSPGYTG